jgi:hypothetical protein
MSLSCGGGGGGYSGGGGPLQGSGMNDGSGTVSCHLRKRKLANCV